MDDIAAEAEVGKATLYRYFADKEQLHFALLDRASNEALVRIATATNSDGRSIRAKLIAVVSAVFEFLFDHPYIASMIIANEARFGDDSPWQKVRNEGKRIVLDYFRQAATVGEFKVRDPQFTALLVAGGVRWIYFYGKRGNATRLGTNLVNFILDGALDRGNNPRDLHNRKPLPL